MIRPILQAPDSRLHIVANMMPFPEQAKEVVQDLTDTFNDTSGCIGLAATQLGLPWRAIIVDVTQARTETYVMVNPVIVKMSEDLQEVNDGCMSVAYGKKRAKTKRPKRITVVWTDPVTEQPKRQKFSGLLAACIHHEIDHLDGVLFVDRILASRGVK